MSIIRVANILTADSPNTSDRPAGALARTISIIFPATAHATGFRRPRLRFRGGLEGSLNPQQRNARA